MLGGVQLIFGAWISAEEQRSLLRLKGGIHQSVGCLLKIKLLIAKVVCLITTMVNVG